jgi:hypothetical protein
VDAVRDFSDPFLIAKYGSFGAATAIFILLVFFRANINELLKQYALDKLLPRLINWVAPRLKSAWWVWLCAGLGLGLAAGLAVKLDWIPFYTSTQQADQANAQLTQQLVAAQNQLQQQHQTEWNDIPAACTIKLIRSLDRIGKLSDMPRTVIAITGPDTLIHFLDDLHIILGHCQLN